MKTSTLNEQVTLLSRKGMKELKKSITQLEKDRHKVFSELREQDKSLGRDERLGRIEKLIELDNIESELEEKRHLLSSSKLLPRRHPNLQVAIGSVVDLIDKHGHFFRFRIVNSVEANPSDGRISTQSPLGKSLLGRYVQDVVELGNGLRTNHFKLLRIS